MLFSLVILATIIGKLDSLYCLSCTGVVSPRHCHSIQKCEEGKVCFTQRYSGINGEVLYDTGCQTPLICSNPIYAHTKQCIKCCSTDACNHQGCGALDYPSSRGPLCFNCPQSMDPAVCSSIRVCHENEVCHLHEEFEFGESYFVSSCSQRNKCGSATASIFGKRSTELCLVCCDSDLCNSDCDNRTRPTPKPSTTTTTTIPTTTLKYPSPFDCWEIFHNGYNTTGIYQIYPWGSNRKSIDVLCNMDVEPKGWTVFQRRYSFTENFTRNWEEYKNGFGNVRGEFWLGNNILHLLTTPHRTLFHIGFTSRSGSSLYERFYNMKVASEAQKYTITLGRASGTAGDRSTNASSSAYSDGRMDGMSFSAYDRDNDLSIGNCAAGLKGGWWFNNCEHVFLNGDHSYNDYRDVLSGSIFNSTILMITRL